MTVEPIAKLQYQSKSTALSAGVVSRPVGHDESSMLLSGEGEPILKPSDSSETTDSLLFKSCKYPEANEPYYTSEEIALLSLGKIPKNVAIIMDGNRRWARKKNFPPMMGHWEGAETLIDLVQAASILGVKTVTGYSFSTENWGRSQEEIEELMNIFEVYLHRKREHMVQEGICFDWIGNLEGMPKRVQDSFILTKKATEHCKKINIVLAVNYGGRDEIRRAVCKILAMHDREKIKPTDVTEALIASQLDTVRFGDPDLVIRTSGEQRVSNFLLWQISYSEFYTTDVLWPDFSPKHFYEALLAFQGRNRRKGAS